MFKDLEGDVALITTKGGISKVVPIAVRTTGEVYLRIGTNAYIRAYENGQTSQPGTSLRELHTEVALFKDAFGRLTTEAARGTALSTAAFTKLLFGKD